VAGIDNVQALPVVLTVEAVVNHEVEDFQIRVDQPDVSAEARAAAFESILRNLTFESPAAIRGNP
jgi:hypothetical protein